MTIKKTEKIAVLLFAMGAPASLKEVKLFLFNLFADPAIIRKSFWVRYPLAFLISSLRVRASKAIYKKLGGASPLIKNTEKQRRALEKTLNKENKNKPYKVFSVMRYTKPQAEDVYKEIKEWGADKLYMIPLYPQFSTTTTASSFDEFLPYIHKLFGRSLTKNHHQILSYPDAEGMIEVMAKNTEKAKNTLSKKNQKRCHYLFSAHGLPKSIVRDGDPYPYECRKTCDALAQKLNLAEDAWTLCYQSKIGRSKWIEPSLKDEIKRAGKNKKAVIVVPISFVSEHSETLYELDVEIKDYAAEQKVPAYARAETVGSNPAFINALAMFVNQ